MSCPQLASSNGVMGLPYIDENALIAEALPPDSAAKPYFQYVVDDPSHLPPGWHIEQSEVAPWFHQPGGGQQFRIINESGETGDVAELVRWGYLRRIN